MRNIIIIFSALFISSLCFATTKTIEDSEAPNAIFDLGIGLGNTFSFHFGGGRIMYFGFAWHHEIFKGVKGEYYDVINWDQFPEDHKDEGNYYNVFLLKLGSNVKQQNSSFYINLGLNAETKYRNCFDDFHILGDNGKYWKKISGKTSFAYGIGGIVKVGNAVAIGGDVSLGAFTSITLSVHFTSR